jgi:hypothetical protein
MRIFSFVLSLIVGLVCWALVLALSDGVAPLGKASQTEGLVFFTPIALFTLPLAILAFVRGQTLASAWLFALAPLFGLANFALSVSAAVHASPAAGVVAEPKTFAVLWCLMLAVALVLLALGRKPAPSAASTSRR